jgi:pyruvate formate-lyase activating enzyme-like uncharacterized protein
MIVELDQKKLSSLKNPAFASYAARYETIYADFMAQVSKTGIEIDPDDYERSRAEILERLQQKGAIFRNGGRSICINRISSACEACRTGLGSATFFISLQCHRDCFYCFNPNQENYAYYTQHQRDVAAELEQISQQGLKVNHLALTGGEPLLHKSQVMDFFRTAREKFPAAHTRLYTSGDHATPEVLQALKDAGLDEIRFSIRMHDLEKGHHLTFERIAQAKAYIPLVMVEMPVLPGTLEVMQEALLELDRLEIFSINLLEFCFPFSNADVFNRKSYRIKNRPYQVLYNYWYAGGLPIAKSELECLALLEFALDNDLKLGVHYCSLENKHTGQVYQQHANQVLPRRAHWSEKDYFLKSAKVFGEDIPKVLKVFRKKNYKRYDWNKEHNYLEFHVNQIRLLKDFEIEIGISTSILENRNGETVLRELKVDLTTPQTFDLEQDL